MMPDWLMPSMERVLRLPVRSRTVIMRWEPDYTGPRAVKPKEGRLNADQKLVYDLVAANPGCTSDELMERGGPALTSKALYKLRVLQLVRAEGKRRAFRYTVI